ncbi:MAG TPA: CapA family protein [Candidatus Paceibacterota bacterium]|nr:CapA family protein [Candidatus Paceibacterota bacterium]
MKPELRTKIRSGFWIVLAGLVGIFSVYFLASFTPSNFKNTNRNAISATAINTLSEKNPSQYFYLNKDANGGPKVSAGAYLVGDLNTGEVILSKNQDQKFPLASISKLMTALVTEEIKTPDDTAQVSKKALSTAGTNGELRLGEKIKTADLLYPLLLESSNDAAEVLAEHFGRDSFISKMNQEAQNLKMSGTSYEDPSGLSANNQSTVSDIFKLVGYLNQSKPEILSITTKRSYSNKKHNWSNISHFLSRDGYIGGKTGYTDPAKQTVVSLFNLPLGQSGNRPIAIALLSSKDRQKDVDNILKYLKKNIYYGGIADASTNWVSLKVGAPDIKDPDFVTFAFAGDIMLDRGVRNSVVKNFNNDYSALFANPNLSKILKDSDIVFANLEGTASDQGKDMHNLYSFRMDPATVPALAGAGIDVLSVANNHVGDWGRNAYIDTLARLKENEILYAGGGNNEMEAEQPAIIEKYGMKIGFIAFSDKGPDSMSATADQAGLLLANNPRFDEIIKNAAKQVDYLVVSFHFGEEYQTKHNARQADLAHKAADDGAKLVIGAHPHVVEDTEIYKNSYIAYSLGNFIFDQSWSQPTMQGGLLEVKLNRDGSMTVKKDTVKLNSAFQPDQVIKGKEEKVKF